MSNGPGEPAPPVGTGFLERLRGDTAAFVMAAIGVLGFSAYMVQRDFRHETEGWRSRVSSVVEDHARLLSAWLLERAADVTVLAAHPSVVAALKPGGAADVALTTHLDRVVADYGYAGVLVVQRDLRVIARSRSGEEMDPVGRSETRQAMTGGRLRVWLAGESFPLSRLGFSMPVRADGGEGAVTGAVVTQMAAERLLPLLYTESVPTESGELVISMPDLQGPSQVRLAPLRHLAPGSPDLRRPADAQLPAVQALRGQTAFAEGRDYRGVPVLAAGRPISMAGWGLVYKIDRSEAMAEFRDRTRVVAVMSLLLILGFLALVLAHRRSTESAQLRGRLEKLRLSAHLRLLLESTGEGICGIDLEGRCTFVNAAAARMIDRQPEELLGREMHALTHHTRPDGSPYPAEDCPVYRAFRTGEAVRREDEVFFTKDGRPFPVAYASFPIVESGALRGAVLTFSDISERRRLEEQLRQSQKMEALGRMAGGIAHDFNNLLTAIVGYADLLLRDPGAAPRQRERLEAIQAAASRAAALVRQLLAFKGRQMLAPRLFDLNGVVSNLRAILGRVMADSVRLRLDLSPEPLTVRADPGQIEQVLVNLVMNARDALPEGGEILINTAELQLAREDLPTGNSQAPPGRYALLLVRDTGIGMASEVLSHVFEPFFTTKEVGQGSGLGLATVYGIVSQSRGFVTVDSTPGEGSTFRVYLPLAQEDPAPQQAL